MARLDDPTSKRQKGLKILNKHKSKTRAECMVIIMAELEIKEAYASTMYAEFRKRCKADGTLKTIYRILEKPVGARKVIKPYVSTTNVFKTKPSDFKTPQAAIDAYVAANVKKSTMAAKLKA